MAYVITRGELHEVVWGPAFGSDAQARADTFRGSNTAWTVQEVPDERVNNGQPGWFYTGAGAEAQLVCQPATAVDYRPKLRDNLREIYSTDIWADVQIKTLHVILNTIITAFRGELVQNKTRLRKDDPANRDEISRLAAKIAMIDNAHIELANAQVEQFGPASRVQIVDALIEGHGVGPVKIHVHEYLDLGLRLANLLEAESQRRESKLENMLVNLRSDAYRSTSSRLVPKSSVEDLRALDPARLYHVLIRTPPQAGQAMAGD